MKLFLIVLVFGFAGACVHNQDELDGDSLDHGLSYDDILSDRGAELKPHTVFELEELLVTPERIAELPTDIKSHPDLVRYAVTRLLEKPSLLDQGVFGVRGREKVFIASRSQVKDNERLYWAMVRVLSEKYSCFISGRKTFARSLHFYCRDGRTVAFQTTEGPDWLQFVGRQFDGEGYEIEVKKRRIVRVSSVPVI